MNARIFRFILMTYFALVTPLLAKDLCTFLEGQKLEDRQLWANGKSGWQTFSSLSEVIRRPETEFAYIVRTDGDTERDGVLVVKTNRPATELDTQRLRNRVKLARRAITADIGCARIGGPADWDTMVSTQSFRDYHDFSARATKALRTAAAPEDGPGIEFDTLRSFHFEYSSERKRRCVRTDNEEYDDFPGDWNSNRAQFSSDQTVVANGVYTGGRLFWAPASPFEGTSDHRVFVRKYGTQGGLACVRFTVPVDSANYTFQISDLESRVSRSSIRRKEQLVRK